ncbi:MAG: hypothetical protein U0Y10_24425 [Spirosomataceae bacterium]
MPYTRFARLFGAVLLVTNLSGCMSLYDPYAYQKDTSLKVEVLNWMDKAKDSLKRYELPTEYIRLELLKAYEYEKNRPKNIESAQLWAIMTDSTEAGSPMGFLSFWRKKHKLSAAFVEQSKIEVGQNFDRIIRLESLKLKK